MYCVCLFLFGNKSITGISDVCIDCGAIGLNDLDIIQKMYYIVLNLFIYPRKIVTVQNLEQF